jgi:hypothetical protein
MNKTVLDLIENMPYEVYGNNYYKGRHYNHEVDYYQWNYDTKSKYYDYQINIFEYGTHLEIYAYKNDRVLPVRLVPKTIANTLDNIASYLNIFGFTVGKIYDYRRRK